MQRVRHRIRANAITLNLRTRAITATFAHHTTLSCRTTDATDPAVVGIPIEIDADAVKKVLSCGHCPPLDTSESPVESVDVDVNVDVDVDELDVPIPVVDVPPTVDPHGPLAHSSSAAVPVFATSPLPE